MHVYNTCMQKFTNDYEKCAFFYVFSFFCHIIMTNQPKKKYIACHSNIALDARCQFGNVARVDNEMRIAVACAGEHGVRYFGHVVSES